MPKKISKWICSYCKEEYDNKIKCNNCEKECSKKYLLDNLKRDWNRHFPSQHTSDTRYEKHCVYCGKKLLGYDIVWDGHRNDFGNIIYNAEDILFEFDTMLCINCGNKVKKKIINALDRMINYERKTVTRNKKS